MIRIMPLVSGIIGANAVTNGLFSVNAYEFLTDGFLTPKSASDGSDNITLHELINAPFAGISQTSGWQTGKDWDRSTLMGMMRWNVQNNGMQMLGGLVLAAALPKVTSKLGLNRNANKAFKALGLNKVVAF
jgi:hypothetical protein